MVAVSMTTVSWSMRLQRPSTVITPLTVASAAGERMEMLPLAPVPPPPVATILSSPKTKTPSSENLRNNMVFMAQPPFLFH